MLRSLPLGILGPIQRKLRLIILIKKLWPLAFAIMTLKYFVLNPFVGDREQFEQLLSLLEYQGDPSLLRVRACAKVVKKSGWSRSDVEGGINHHEHLYEFLTVWVKLCGCHV